MIEFDPRNLAHVDGQAETLRRLREQEPVSEQSDFWYLARHADIVEAFRSPDKLHQDRFVPIELDVRGPDELNLGETNGAEHTCDRKTFSSFLSPPRIRQLEPRVRDVAGRLVEHIVQKGSGDLVADLAAQLPGEIIGPLTGLTDLPAERFRQYSEAFIKTRAEDAAVAQASIELIVSFEEAAKEALLHRRETNERPDDFLTRLIDAVDQHGQPLSDKKILVYLTKDMVVGGIETTMHLIGSLFYNLLSTPGAYRRVRDDRNLVAPAVEETLRLSGPVQVSYRRASEDVTVGGVCIPSGSVVALGQASGNLDDAVFPDSECFSLDRGPSVRNMHLGFGHGSHLCVGAPLARLEATCALEAVLDRIPVMNLAPGFSYERVRFWRMSGPVKIDVVLGHEQSNL